MTKQHQNITIIQAISNADKQAAFSIRREVFVNEQQRSQSLEESGNDEATHYLARFGDMPVGAARWRKTENGIKLERIAVLSAYRNKSIGSALLQKMLNEVAEQNLPIYLHSQMAAAALYARHGFKQVGEPFIEAETPHIKMVLQNAERQ